MGRSRIADLVFKAETHGATNRCEASRRVVASSALLLRKAACAHLVASICRTNSNQFEFVRQIAATRFCRRDNDFHMSHEAICCSNLSRRPVAAICRIVCLGLQSDSLHKLFSVLFDFTSRMRLKCHKFSRASTMSPVSK